jgi:hypothetical protein
MLAQQGGEPMDRDGLTLLCTALLLIAVVVGGCFALEWAYTDDDPITDISAQQRR